MKKVQLKFDKEAIRQFFLQHVEKLVVAATGVCFLLIVYSAFARPSFDLTPEKLRESAQTAQRHIEQTPPPAEAETPAPLVVSLPDVQEDQYRCHVLWKPTLFERLGKRTAPELFPLEGLRGVAGSGVFEMKPPEVPAAAPESGATAPPGGQNLRGQRWIVLTAKVPYLKQVEEYRQRFAKAEFRDQAKDTPRYCYYQVQRAELSGPGATPNPSDWVSLDLRKLMALRSQWSREAGEVVDARYLIQDKIFVVDRLAFYLGPWVGANLLTGPQWRRKSNENPWGPEVAYPPDIPLAAQEATPPPPAQDTSPTPSGPLDPFSLDAQAGPSGQAATAGQAARSQQAPPYRLFRFFDFEVESGKTYVYRVRLWLVNPNDGIEDRYLAPEVLARREEIMQRAAQQTQGGDTNAAQWTQYEWRFPMTAWSNVTAPIYVPRDSRVLAVSVDPPSPSLPDAQPECKMLLVRWVKERGITAFEELVDVERGQVLNLLGKRFSPSGRKITATASDGPEDDSFPVDYVTEKLVLDMWARRFSSRESGPGEVLLMDENGNLVLHKELQDRPQYERLLSTRQGQTASAPPPPPSGEPGRPRPVKLN